MKINTKIMLMIATGLVLTSFVIGAMAVWQLQKSSRTSIAQIQKSGKATIAELKKQGEREISLYRKDTIKAKKSLLRSEVQTAVSFLEKAFTDTQAMLEGGLTEEVKKTIVAENQENIAKFIGQLRYGPKNKDYFWINDMHPRMVMDPQKPTLNGKDLSDIKDPNGKKLFMEFVKLCREKGQGYVNYLWPKYGADKLQPKLSFVKLFKKWGWVIGTGMYTDNIDAAVKARQAALQKKTHDIQIKMKQQISENDSLVRKNIKHVVWWVSAISLLIVVIALLFSYWFTRRSITLPVNRIVESLSEGASQVAMGSGQVSSASQSLAEGASEQAASIEETSSSLEEMSSMTKQNAENARQADTLMKEANKVVENANEAMGQLTSSMVDISKASEETQKIIKTIDEIAFQTNLLALNAAVEAARAGEAGAGFAVVADEVRNLAMRTADAAKNTADLIEGTVKKIKDGSALVKSTNKAFTGVASSTSKVGELVAEIAAASNEQAQGIEQVNTAISEMDRVIQQNAANAEESASASEEMNAQAEYMSGVVDDLITLVRGNKNGDSLHSDVPPVKRVLRQRKDLKASGAHEPEKYLETATGEQVSPDQVIPMDDDFQNF